MSSKIFNEAKEAAFIIDMYAKQKKTLREIGLIINHNHDYVRRRLIKYGVKRRTPSKRKRVTKEKINEVIKLYEKYHSSITVGKEVELSRVYVIRILKEHGIEVNKGRYMPKSRKEYIINNAKTKTITEMAKELGITKQTVGYWIRYFNLVPYRKYAVPESKWKNVLRDYNNRVPYITEKYSMSQNTLRRIILLMGGKMRRHRRA